MATKIDCRKENIEDECVSKAKGESLARLIGAIGFFECSSRNEV